MAWYHSQMQLHMISRGQKFHSFACNYEWILERTSNSSQSTHPVGRVWSCRTGALGKITLKSYYVLYYLMFFIAYAFKGQVNVFAGWVKIVSHSSCRTSAILKYFCPLISIWSYPLSLSICSHMLRFLDSLYCKQYVQTNTKLLPKTTWPIWNEFGTHDPWVTLYQMVSA